MPRTRRPSAARHRPGLGLSLERRNDVNDGRVDGDPGGTCPVFEDKSYAYEEGDEAEGRKGETMRGERDGRGWVQGVIQHICKSEKVTVERCTRTGPR